MGEVIDVEPLSEHRRVRRGPSLPDGRPRPLWKGASGPRVDRASALRSARAEKIKERLRQADVEEPVCSLDRLERAFASEGADALETRAASFVLYVDQLLNLNTTYNRQRRFKGHESVGLSSAEIYGVRKRRVS